MKKPEFSLVIPVAPGRSAEVLGSVKNINYPKNKFETIVVPGPNASLNRNQGIKKARGEIIGFMDDDAVVDGEILNEVRNFFRAHQDYEILGGPQLTPEDDSFFARVSGYALSSPLCALRFSNRYGGKKINLDANEFDLTTANCFARKSVFEKIGDFNVNLFPGEDTELFSRAKLAEIKVAYAPEIKVFHRRRTAPVELARQNFRFGYVSIPRMRNSRFNPSLLALLVAFVFVIASPALYFIMPWLALPGLLYLAGVFFVSAYLAAKHRHLLAFCPLVYIILIMHLSYGFGMLAYLLRSK